MSAVDIRCLKCGARRLIRVEQSPSGQITLVVCEVCRESSLIATGQARVCGTCNGIGSHEDGCINDRPWAV